MLSCIYRNIPVRAFSWSLLVSALLTGCSGESDLEDEAAAAWKALEPYTQNPSQYVQGIDVSHWNGKIDWPAVKSDNVIFAYIKVSEGITFTDEQLVNNWPGSDSVNIIRGGYHVFTPGDNGEEQAYNFLNSLSSVQQGYIGTLPPALDIEQIPQDEIEESRPEVQAWLDTVAHTLGCAPVIYTSPGTWNGEYPGKFADYRLWLADWDIEPTLPTGWKEWLFWQYTDTDHASEDKDIQTGIKGKIRGIQDDTDLDFYKGSVSSLILTTCSEGL